MQFALSEKASDANSSIFDLWRNKGKDNFFFKFMSVIVPNLWPTRRNRKTSGMTLNCIKILRPYKWAVIKMWFKYNEIYSS